MDGHRDWIMKAEEYAEDRYGVSLEALGWEFQDASVIMDCPIYWVDEAFKNMDPTPDVPGEPAMGWSDHVNTVNSLRR